MKKFLALVFVSLVFLRQSSASVKNFPVLINEQIGVEVIKELRNGDICVAGSSITGFKLFRISSSGEILNRKEYLVHDSAEEIQELIEMENGDLVLGVLKYFDPTHSFRNLFVKWYRFSPTLEEIQSFQYPVADSVMHSGHPLHFGIAYNHKRILLLTTLHHDNVVGSPLWSVFFQSMLFDDQLGLVNMSRYIPDSMSTHDFLQQLIYQDDSTFGYVGYNSELHKLYFDSTGRVSSDRVWLNQKDIISNQLASLRDDCIEKLNDHELVYFASYDSPSGTELTIMAFSDTSYQHVTHQWDDSIYSLHVKKPMAVSTIDNKTSVFIAEPLYLMQSNVYEQYFYFAKLDEQLNIIWERKYSDKNIGVGNTVVASLEDGSHLVSAYQTDTLPGGHNPTILIKIEKDGWITGINSPAEVRPSTVLYPNPGVDFIRINQDGVNFIRFYDGLGKLIRVEKDENGSFPVDKLEKGLYFYTFADPDSPEREYSGKWLKE